MLSVDEEVVVSGLTWLRKKTEVIPSVLLIVFVGIPFMAVYLFIIAIPTLILWNVARWALVPLGFATLWVVQEMHNDDSLALVTKSKLVDDLMYLAMIWVTFSPFALAVGLVGRCVYPGC